MVGLGMEVEDWLSLIGYKIGGGCDQNVSGGFSTRLSSAHWLVGWLGFPPPHSSSRES